MSKTGASAEDVRFVKETLISQQAGAALLYSPLGPLAATLNTTDWRKFETAMDFVNERSAASVETMLQAIESGQHLASWAGGCEPYLSKLLAGSSLPRNEVVLNAAGLLQGGVDTTANTLSWLLVHLADNPREQELLFEELTEVLGDGGFDNEALPRLPRLKAVIRESHRLTPTISANVRTLSEPIELIDTRRGGLAVTIPANTRMAFSSIGWSGDSAYAEAPEQFQPARWMVPKAERKGSALEALDHNLLAHPFSFGPRMCLGARVAQAELHAMIARLVRAFRFKTDVSAARWEVRNDFLTKPTPFPKINFERRVGGGSGGSRSEARASVEAGGAEGVTSPPRGACPFGHT